MSCAVCAVCALDVPRVEAYANSYHGNSWASEVLNFDEFPGGGMGLLRGHYWDSFSTQSCRSLLRHTLIHTLGGV